MMCQRGEESLLKGGHLAMFGDAFYHLVLQNGCYWQLQSTGQRCCQTPNDTRTNPDGKDASNLIF